jgi:hypothetical protein
MIHLAIDSVRAHNELLHAGYTRHILIAIPVLVLFAYAWTKFVKH